jgi:hypothetical protein
MAHLHDAMRDAALGVLDSADRIVLLEEVQTVYATAVSGILGERAIGGGGNPTFGSAEARPGGGRRRVLPAFEDGTVSATTSTEAAAWAILDDSGSRVLASGAISSPQFVIEPNTWRTTAALPIGFPGDVAQL